MWKKGNGKKKQTYRGEAAQQKKRKKRTKEDWGEVYNDEMNLPMGKKRHNSLKVDRDGGKESTRHPRTQQM